MPKPRQQQSPDAGEEVLRWRSYPLVDDYPRSVLLLGAIVGACVLVAAAFGGAGYALLAGLLLCVSLARYLLPTEFTLDRQGAEARFMGQRRRMSWSRVRRVSVQRKGVFLSERPAPSRLDSFRGMQLRFANNAEEVVSFVEDKVATVSQVP